MNVRTADISGMIRELQARDDDAPVRFKSSLSGPRSAGIKHFIEEAALLADVDRCQVVEDKGILTTNCLYRLEGTAYTVRRALTAIYNGMCAHGS